MANIIRTGGGGSVELTGNAQPSDVAEGKTFYSNNGEVKQTGTLPVRIDGQAQNLGLWQGKLYMQRIPEGIYKPLGSANSPEVYIDASVLGNASPSDVLNGGTFTSTNGVKITGTIPKQGAWGTTINPGGSVTIPKGYHNGGGVVRANTPIAPKLKQLGVVSLYGAGLGNTLTQHKTTTFNVANVYSRFRDLTTSDFPIPLKQCSAGTAEQFGNCGITSMSYNPSNGVLTINYDASSYYNSAGADVYIYCLDRYGL